MKIPALRVLLLVLFSLAIAATGWFWLTSPASRDLGRTVAGWQQESTKGAILKTEFSITSVSRGLDKLEGLAATLHWQAPRNLKIETEIGKDSILACRNGEQVWIFQPEKQFAVFGSSDVPRFTADPASVEQVDLPDLQLPVASWQIRLLPLLLKVEKTKERVSISPGFFGRKLAELPDFHIQFHEDGQIEIAVSGSDVISAKIDDFAWLPSGGINWSLPKEAEPFVEKVALSHLEKCARVVVKQLGAKTQQLPPATGKRELIASSGPGRLENHDGVRVLFLEGSPEEMGRQQGELLAEEVRAVTDRILYGVGVGSSFAKGRWFFGEIEDAQSRVGKFTAPEYLREMDALADAAGMHRQETRLSNFFPELFHCSGFALHGPATRDGKMYHGRILDYIRGAGLEDNAVVAIYQPNGANAWVNVTYAGFVGSVTAMNEKHIAIGEMGGKGEGNWDGKPMAQLIREVMENCDTIDEAVELMRAGPRTCEYYYVISDGKSGRAVGIKATPEIFETVWSGEAHPQLPDPVENTVLLSSGDRYKELVRRVKQDYGNFDADSARELMTRPVCMNSNIQSVLFAPESLDLWVANADSENVASHTRYTKFNLADLLGEPSS
ncbi:MAG: C45 family autoproteolytic acyltransferase/hydrolase [Verrucomicrobiales bacterium]|nr:C45 family autoproteolytic acyltransferase/hydrolase [Verrucomicrobiales bacterium]